MEVEEVELFIDKDGRVRIEVRGIKGMSCLDLTKDLEEMLGGEVESREMTAEAYTAVEEQKRNRQQLRGRS
jgi:hypothetical protein